MKNTNAIKKGDDLFVRGSWMTVIKVHPFGTYDVVSKTGKTYRITGLAGAVNRK